MAFDNDMRDHIARSIVSISMQCHEITLVFKMKAEDIDTGKQVSIRATKMILPPTVA